MAKLQLIRVVLSTGKTVYLREMLISDTETAAQKVSARANGDQNVLQILMQKALVQSLIVKIADSPDVAPRDLTANERQDLDGLFKVSEYGQLLKVVGKLSGAEDMGKEPQITFMED